MELSVADLGSTYGTRIKRMRPQAYSLYNESGVSNAFTESMEAVGGGLTPVPPVQYKTAEIVSSKRINQMDMSRQVNAAFNDIASQYSDAVTGYGSDSQAYSYSVSGSNFDAYA